MPSNAAWIIILLIAALVIRWVLSRSRRYSKLFDDQHFLELALAMPSLKKAALDRIDQPPGSERDFANDPRLIQTSAGLAVVYTVSSTSPDEFVHRLSVSLPGHVTPRGVGRRFLTLAVLLLGIPPQLAPISQSASTVHHLEFSFTEAEHRKFADRPVREITPENVAAFRQEVEAELEKTFPHRPA